MPTKPLPVLLIAAALSCGGHARAQQVTVYRCTDDGGRLTLRDTPCAPGQSQEVRQMQRPQDPPRIAAPAPSQDPPPAPTAQAQPAPQVVYRTPLQPMYECVNAENGERYSSDNDAGNPRLVPLWTLGYKAGLGPGGRIVPFASTWIRDACQMLPQQEACARLSDRRYEIIRRYNSALQSERRQLQREQRGIEARMANDCGSY